MLAPDAGTKAVKGSPLHATPKNGNAIEIDHSSQAIVYYHKSSLVLLAATPLALAAAAVSPTLALPIDLGLALVIPAHMHVGMNFVITDQNGSVY